VKNNKVYVENKHLVLVLDNGFMPVNVCNMNNAYKLISKNRAEIVEVDDTPIFTAERAYQRPTVIRLLNSIRRFEKKISVTRSHIFKRDNHTCAYCGGHGDYGKNTLTVDHVIPASRGGQYTWQNLVTCCRKCNSKKDDRTPEEAGMPLLYQPFRPSFIRFINEFNGTVRKGWEVYLQEHKKEKVLY